MRCAAKSAIDRISPSAIGGGRARRVRCVECSAGRPPPGPHLYELLRGLFLRPPPPPLRPVLPHPEGLVVPGALYRPQALAYQHLLLHQGHGRSLVLLLLHVRPLLLAVKRLVPGLDHVREEPLQVVVRHEVGVLEGLPGLGAGLVAAEPALYGGAIVGVAVRGDAGIGY